MKQIGLGLAVAVLIDATLVRMVLVPAAEPSWRSGGGAAPEGRGWAGD